MTWWGKVIGGTFGFVLGGPLGAALGAVVGHQFDRGRSRLSPGDQERTQAAFFTATFSVMGHLAKADGRVSASEIAMAEGVMRQMRLNKEQRKAAVELFNQGKQSSFSLEQAVDQLRQECHRRRTLLQMFLEIQIQAALADGRISTAEKRVLGIVAERIGIPRLVFEQLLGMISGAAYSGTSHRAHRPIDDLASAYQTLGVSANTSLVEVKKAYRRLMNQHHPDKLVARGLPQEMVELATEKTQKIRAAYEQVKQARGRAH